MTTTERPASDTNTGAEVPHYPVVEGRCPFEPPKAYVDWREESGLTRVRLWDGSTPWLVTRADYFRQILEDPRFSADRWRPGMPMTAQSSTARLPQRASFRQLDGAEHRRLRRMINQDFAAPAVAASEPEIQRIVDELIDSILAKGAPADIVADFALPLPLRLLSHILGLPWQDRDFFTQKVTEMLSRGASAEEAEQSGKELAGYIIQLVERVKDEAPADTILSRLVHNQLAKDAITMPELLSTVTLLIGGGFETTAHAVASSFLALLRDSDQLVALRDSEDKDFVANAVNQMLRYVPVIDNGLDRVAVEDVEIDGHVIRAGEGVILNVPTSNHDPRSFADPDTLEIARVDENKHLAFGWGPHQCIAQVLARAELRIALTALVKRLPGARLSVPEEEIVWDYSKFVVGVERLPVTWDE